MGAEPPLASLGLGSESLQAPSRNAKLVARTVKKRNDMGN
jgi:hypothetical protein